MVKDDQFVSASKIQKRFGISSSSLRRWDGEGKIQTIRTPGGFRLYNNKDIEIIFSQGESEIEPTKTKICYARVSSPHQQGDLERQVESLREEYPEHEIIKDTGSGLNYKRKGFQTLLERVYSGTVSEVAITHKDRFCRYGFELVEFIFKKAGTKILVQGQRVEEQDSTRELADDLFAVCNYFVAKNNGMHSAENRRKRKRAEKEETKDKEKPKKEEKIPVGKTKKIRLYPNPKQRKTLMKWIGTVGGLIINV